MHSPALRDTKQTKERENYIHLPRKTKIRKIYSPAHGYTKSKTFFKICHLYRQTQNRQNRKIHTFK